MGLIYADILPPIEGNSPCCAEAEILAGIPHRPRPMAALDQRTALVRPESSEGRGDHPAALRPGKEQKTD